MWIDDERRWRAAERANAYQPTLQKLERGTVDVTLKPDEAREVLKWLGGSAAENATNAQVAEAIATRGSILALQARHNNGVRP
ncbi:hypothetical protein AAFG13_06100 [Bradyrhizobium sp. B124]|uniref:hypothetical protein n=1 Tax=Bradyrhizobium sp. B124 TaxID=3140245 RepID=UPI0031832C92